MEIIKPAEINYIGENAFDRNNSFQIEFVFKENNEPFVPENGYYYKFGLKRRYEDETLIYSQNNLTLDSESALTIAINATEFNFAPSIYYYELQLIEGTNKNVVLVGKIEIRDTIN